MATVASGVRDGKTFAEVLAEVLCDPAITYDEALRLTEAVIGTGVPRAASVGPPAPSPRRPSHDGERGTGDE